MQNCVAEVASVAFGVVAFVVFFDELGVGTFDWFVARVATCRTNCRKTTHVVHPPFVHLIRFA